MRLTVPATDILLDDDDTVANYADFTVDVITDDDEPFHCENCELPIEPTEIRLYVADPSGYGLSSHLRHYPAIISIIC